VAGGVSAQCSDLSGGRETPSDDSGQTGDSTYPRLVFQLGHAGRVVRLREKRDDRCPMNAANYKLIKSGERNANGSAWNGCTDGSTVPYRTPFHTTNHTTQEASSPFSYMTL
jgi:hypothetical protein